MAWRFEVAVLESASEAMVFHCAIMETACRPLPDSRSPDWRSVLPILGIEALQTTKPPRTPPHRSAGRRKRYPWLGPQPMLSHQRAPPSRRRHWRTDRRRPALAAGESPETLLRRRSAKRRSLRGRPQSYKPTPAQRRRPARWPRRDRPPAQLAGADYRQWARCDCGGICRRRRGSRRCLCRRGTEEQCRPRATVSAPPHGNADDVVTISVPALTIVPPVYVSVPETTARPGPVLIRPPAPL